ncbi:hypothetical protein [Candidatus Magnetaquicoccus inordinatus]|uniref:hypothetical protein n=1 Tax=Candidatus Magnetaquicoccus inordinatus TaxID=2496818 RepID=UPI00102C5E8A|nr:hypothetical protein [Candidatus Magnetaquicoccus inordinatus]
MNRSLRWSLIASALLLNSCSSNFSLPWDANLLDPARVATREPLEIPPDLHKLPSPDDARRNVDARTPSWSDPARAPSSKSSRSSTVQLPAPVPLNQDDGISSRSEQEKLPSWMGSGSSSPTGKK